MACGCGRKSAAHWNPRGLTQGNATRTPSQRRAVNMQSARNAAGRALSASSVEAQKKEIQDRRRALAMRRAGMI